MIIIVRFWRIIRVINGIVLSAKSNADNRVKKEKEKVKELQLEVDALRTQNEVLKSIVETSCTNEDTKVYTDDGRVVTGKTLAVAARQESLPSYSTASNLISVSMDPVDDDNVFK